MRFFLSSLALYLLLLLLCRGCLGGEAEDLLSKAEASSATAESKASAFIEGLKQPNLTNFGQKFVKDIPLPYPGKGSCKGSKLAASILVRDNKCASRMLQSSQEKDRHYFDSQIPSTAQLLVFVSASMPKASLQKLWAQTHKAGGKLALRGLVGNSFKETQSRIQELGIVADIDPVKFEEFDVKQVPTFILYEGRVGNFDAGLRHDRLVGNISLKACLEQFATSGELKEAANSLFQKLGGEK
jgi:conjugal transfer pilus assembly protein TrbC